MTYLDFPKMLGNFWKRPVNIYDEEGLGGADEHPAAEEVRGGSILKDVAIWFIWIVMVALALLAIACQEHNVPEEMRGNARDARAERGRVLDP